MVDKLLFHVQMARVTYLSKIAEDRKDVNASLGLSVSINHAISIPIAILGGRLWVSAGSHRPVFLCAGAVAALTFITCTMIRTPDAPPVRSG
jgi:hypothetical protein